MELVTGKLNCNYSLLRSYWLFFHCKMLEEIMIIHGHQNNWRFTMTWEAGWRYGIISTVPYEQQKIYRQNNNLISENILSFHQFNRLPVSSRTVNCFDVYGSPSEAYSDTLSNTPEKYSLLYEFSVTFEIINSLPEIPLQCRLNSLNIILTLN